MFEVYRKKLLKRLPIAFYPYKPFMLKYRCLFVHIPKNAGTSVLSLFKDNNGRKHASWREFYESNDYLFNKMTRFSIIRNPASRALSAYNYIIKGGNGSKLDLHLRDKITSKASTFEQFVEHVLDSEFVYSNMLFKPQYIFLYDSMGCLRIEHLLKYESLTSDWQQFASQNNLPELLPWENKSAPEVEQSISDSTLDKLKIIYSKDYELLKYS